MTKTKKVIILGAGGMCIDILDVINELNAQTKKPLYTCIGFLDDDKKKLNKTYYGVKVLGSLEKAKEFFDVYFVNGIGNANNFLQKKTLTKKLGIPLTRYINIIHPTASVSKMATIGIGSVIFQNVSVASGTKIGNHVLVMANSVVNHDVRIGDYTFVTAGVCISGFVSIGTSCYLGTNSSIKGKVSIGRNSLIGMGSVVLSDVASNSVYVGNPAKFLRATK